MFLFSFVLLFQAVREVMRKKCGCNDLFNLCAGQTCPLTAANFSIIASEIRRMYDRSAMLSYDNNGQINLKAPEDSLVFTYGMSKIMAILIIIV